MTDISDLELRIATLERETVRGKSFFSRGFRVWWNMWLFQLVIMATIYGLVCLFGLIAGVATGSFQ